MSDQNKITYKQDTAPSGGYKRIQISRLPTWSPKAGVLIALVAAFVPVGVYDYQRRRHRALNNLIEEDEGRSSIEPLLAAESDRLVLWQMRRNRDEENALMKDVPGWQTGTWFGQPLYKTNPNSDEWVPPTHIELYAHTRLRDMENHLYNKHWYG